MKKFILGFVCGGLMLGAVGVYASDKIEAYLFPVDFQFNEGQVKSADGEYTTLNYNGHAYVSVRFIAENLGGYVYYDDSAKRIKISYFPPSTIYLTDSRYPFIHAGIIQLAVDGGHTLIKEAVSINPGADPDVIHELQFSIKFYDIGNKLIGEFSWTTSDMPLNNGEIRYIMDSFPGDATSYTKAVLEVTKHLEKSGL